MRLRWPASDGKYKTNEKLADALVPFLVVAIIIIAAVAIFLAVRA